jgi:hypothetical protein
MTKKCFLFPLFILFILLSNPIEAQRSAKYEQKLEEIRQQNWPPERVHSRVSLGYALQKTFKRHCEYCGFQNTHNRRRDFVPADISKFLGRRTLRTKVETADIRGGGLLYYIFKGEDLDRSFDDINYSPSKVFRLSFIEDQFTIDPDDNFDTYLFHKTCTGYLKSALDAGIQPPYSSFQIALDTDSRRESSVLALSGSFVSPLSQVMEANNAQTTAAMLQLWQFYQNNPEYVDNAYYLREFEGVMLKHISSSEQNYRIETAGGLNFSGPLPAHLNTSINYDNNGQSIFSGTDWETIVYTDFSYPDSKVRLFSPLPSPTDIQQYLKDIHPVFQYAQDLPLMIEGIEHQHYLTLIGIPEYMTTNFWVIEKVKAGVYDGMPSLEATPYFDETSQSPACKFTVRGRPLSSNFSGPIDQLPGKLNASYTIRSKYPVGDTYLYLNINEEIQTSSHPIASIADGRFDLTKKDGWEFAFQWKFAIEVEDEYNPVNFDIKPYIANLNVRRSGKTINVRIVEVESDEHRNKFYVTLESQETFPLERIDNSSLQNYNLSFDLHLESKASKVVSVRPIKGILRFPAIKESIIPTIPNLLGNPTKFSKPPTSTPTGPSSSGGS